MFTQKENNQTDANHLLSDHHPFMIHRDGAVCFVWNILVQMKGDKFYNNGFGCALETDEQYISRLHHLSSQINTMIQEKKPAFICLQETPKKMEDNTLFISLLNSDYQSESLNSESTQVTLYNTKDYTYEAKLTQIIKNSPLSEGLLNRVIPLVLLNNRSEETFLLINVHANFSKDIKNDVISLHEAAKRNGINHVLFAGDFNRDLADHQLADNRSKHDIYEALNDKGCFDNLYVCSTPNASFMAQKDKETNQVNQVLETRDGCLTSMEVSVESMSSLNQPALDVKTSVCKDLSKIPEDLNNLNTSSCCRL